MNLPFHRQVDEQRSHLVRWNGGERFTTERNLKLTETSQPQFHECPIPLETTGRILQ